MLQTLKSKKNAILELTQDIEMKSFIKFISEKNEKKNEEENIPDIPGQLSLGQEYERAEELRAKQREEAAEDREFDRQMYRRPRK